MNPNWIGVVAVAFSLVAFAGAFASFSKAGRRPSWGVLWIACVLALPGASFAVYYAHILPEPTWYYEFRSWRGTEFLVVFIGLAAGLVAARLPRILLPLPLLGALAFSAVPFLKPVLGPLSPDVFSDRWDGDVCLQSTRSSCGLASSATLLRHFGIEATERELSWESYTDRGGTEAWYMARALRARGCEVEFEFHDGFDSNMTLPAVVGVRLHGFGHFISILSREGDSYTTGDPLHGREELTGEALLKRYEFTGFSMVVSPKP